MVGFHSDMMWLPEHQVGAVVLTNGDPGWIVRDEFRRNGGRCDDASASALLAGHGQDRPLIVMGDLNDEPPRPPPRSCKARGCG